MYIIDHFNKDPISYPTASKFWQNNLNTRAYRDLGTKTFKIRELLHAIGCQTSLRDKSTN